MDINTTEGMAQAVQWTRDHLDKIATGGHWIIPRSGTIVQVFHGAKVVRVTRGFAPDESISRVLAECGYRVVEWDGSEEVPYA